MFQRLGWLLVSTRADACASNHVLLQAHPLDLPPPCWQSFALLGLFSLGCGYLGVLFSKLAVALPQAETMEDLGAAAMGRVGE